MSPSKSLATRRSPRSGIITLVATVVALSVALTGCTGAPEAQGSAQLDPTAAAQEPTDESTAPAADPQKGPFYSLTPTAGPLDDASLEATWHALSTADTDATPPTTTRETSPGTTVDQLGDGALVDELGKRWRHAWSELDGGLGTTPDRGPSLERQEVAVKLVALSFIQKDQDGAVRAARDLLGQDGVGRDLRLLAAAAHEHDGNGAQVEKILGGLGYCPVALKDATPSPAGDDEAAPFEVVGLSFAQSIEGPGKFVPLDPEELAPGKPVLVYGEFRNFTSLLAAPEESAKPLYRRGFRATLRLLTEDDEEIDRLEFLPEKRGRQTVSTLADVTNFWARYRLPSNLKPGSYKLVVDAEDLLGKAPAEAELPLEIRSH